MLRDALMISVPLIVYLGNWLGYIEKMPFDYEFFLSSIVAMVGFWRLHRFTERWGPGASPIQHGGVAEWIDVILVAQLYILAVLYNTPSTTRPLPQLCLGFFAIARWFGQNPEFFDDVFAPLFFSGDEPNDPVRRPGLPRILIVPPDPTEQQFIAMEKTFELNMPKKILMPSGLRIGLKTDRDILGSFQIDAQHKVSIVALKGKATIIVPDQEPVEANGFGVHEFVSETTGSVDIKVTDGQTFSFIASASHTNEPCEGKCTFESM